MGLLIVIAGGVAFWLWHSGRLASLTLQDGAAAAIGLIGVRLLSTGRLMIGAMLIAMAAGWLAYRLRRPAAAMSVTDARALLELPDDADAGAVKAAHRRLIARVHPDAGGTEALARNVNLARDILMKELRRTASNTVRGA